MLQAILVIREEVKLGQLTRYDLPLPAGVTHARGVPFNMKCVDAIH